MKKNVLMTGRPGVGKTTLIRRVVKELGTLRVGGFYTEELRDKDGVRTGFRIQTLDGKKGILAQVGLKSPYRVGKYGVNRKAIEEVINPAIGRALKKAGLLVLDEIGKMELVSEGFQELVLKALDSPIRVMATVPSYPLAFVDKIKARKDVTLLEVTERNRDDLALALLKEFEKRSERF